MKNKRTAICACLRIAAVIILPVSIIKCLSNLAIGCIGIIMSLVLWNIGGYIVSYYEKRILKNFDSSQNAYKFEENKINIPIDYSHLPFNVDEPISSMDNRFQVLNDITLINAFLEDAYPITSQLLNICTEEVTFSGPECSYFEYPPNTKTGKIPKYIAIVHFRTENYAKFQATENYFGDIYYLRDGSIGKARIICWLHKTMYEIDLGIIGTTLSTKKISIKRPYSENKQILYKSN